MAASASKDKAAKAKDAQRKDEEREAQRRQKEKAAKAKQKEREAEQKRKEKEARRKEKEKEARRKEKEKERKAKEKDKQREAKRKEEERAAKAKAKQREARQKEKEREERAKAKRDAQRASNAKERERADKARAKEREAERKEREREKAAKEKARARREAARSGSRTARTAAADESGAGSGAEPAVEPVQPVEEVAVPERGETTEVPAEVRDEAADGTDEGAPAAGGSGSALAPLPDLDVPDNDKTVRPKGYLAEALGKEDAVGRSTQRATLAASYTTRDHDVIRAWASTRGGRPADVAGTGRGNGAGVLRIEFPDGPGDDSRLEDIDWSPFFATFDESDVDFLYQERVRTGDVSRFHKFVRADR